MRQIVKKLAEADYKTNGYAPDLLLDQGCRIGGPVQVRAAFGDNKKHAEYMDNMLEKDKELSATKIHQLIVRKFGKKIPTQTIRRKLRQKLQWVVVRMKTGPMISDNNKVKRMEFAKQ